MYGGITDVTQGNDDDLVFESDVGGDGTEGN